MTLCAQTLLGATPALPWYVPFFFRHAWLICTCINVVYLKIYSQRYIRENPGLAPGYAQLIRGYLFWGNLPWLVMGAGIVIGGLPNVFSYFRPRDGTPFVLAFWSVVILEWILGFWWLFFARGAEFLIKHPGLIRGVRSPAILRSCYCVSIAGGVAALVFMWFAEIPVHPF